MTSLEQMKRSGKELVEVYVDDYHVQEQCIEDLNHLIEATYNARTQEVVEIAEGMSAPKSSDPWSNEYPAGYDAALFDLITALSPDETVKS